MSVAQQFWDVVCVAWIIDEWRTTSIPLHPSCVHPLASVMLAHRWENNAKYVFCSESNFIYINKWKIHTVSLDLEISPQPSPVKWSYNNPPTGRDEILTKAWSKILCCSLRVVTVSFTHLLIYIIQQFTVCNTHHNLIIAPPVNVPLYRLHSWSSAVNQLKEHVVDFTAAGLQTCR